MPGSLVPTATAASGQGLHLLQQLVIHAGLLHACRQHRDTDQQREGIFQAEISPDEISRILPKLYQHIRKERGGARRHVPQGIGDRGCRRRDHRHPSRLSARHTYRPACGSQRKENRNSGNRSGDIIRPDTPAHQPQPYVAASGRLRRKAQPPGDPYGTSSDSRPARRDIRRCAPDNRQSMPAPHRLDKGASAADSERDSPAFPVEVGRT